MFLVDREAARFGSGTPLLILTFTLLLCNIPLAMIPFHYFLLFFALLMSMMGCTQNAPPGSRQTLAANNTSQLSEASPSPSASPSASPVAEPPVQTINNKPDVVKPSEATAPTTIEMTPENGARDWKIVIKGADAEKLYKIMAVKHEDARGAHRDLDAEKKSGKHMECFSPNKKGQFQCEILLEAATGELQVLNKKLDARNADETLVEQYKSDIMEINTPEIGGGKIALSNLTYTQVEAKKIFEHMSKAKAFDLAPGGEFLAGKQLKGKHVDCYQQFKKDNPTEALYSCNFWILNSLSGEFEEIK